MRGGPVRWLGVAVTAAVVVGLGGCENLVTSEKPLIEAKDAVTDGTLKAGWWVAQAPGCDVDAALPSEQWPDCAKAVLVPPRLSDKRRVKIEDVSGAPKVKIGYRLAAGEPMVLRMSLMAPLNIKGVRSVHFYKAVRATERDAQGRIVEFRHWAVVCGPLEPSLGEEYHYRRMSNAPWPGIEPRSEGCFARDQTGLREAAQRSEALAVAASPPLRWLRDRRPDDQTFDQWLLSWF
jgi:hypothetical protein